jgi:ketosteroid isomerase-like protein
MVNEILLITILSALVTFQPAPGFKRAGLSNSGAKSTTPSQKRTPKEKLEQTLRMLTEELIQAYPKHEPSVLDRILADDLTVINPDGSLGDKAGETVGIRSGKLKLESVTNDDVKVRVFGETAVVTGRATIKGVVEGREIRDQNRYTCVFVKRRGQWQVINLQITRVAQQ